MSLTSRSAVAATVLIVPVAIELAWPPFGDNAAGLVVFAVSQLAGWLLLFSVCRAVGAPGTRVAGFGRRSVLVGCVSQMLFAASFGLTALDGEPWERSFAFFLLGFLALFVGGLSWGVSELRTATGKIAGTGLTGTALLGLLAMAAGMDPWHDIFLLSSYAAWMLVGRGFDRVSGRDVAVVPSTVSTV